jgi:small membrane protein
VISVAQLFLLSLGLLVMGAIVLRYRQRKIGLVIFLLWFLLWSGIEVVILFPKSAMEVAHLVGIGRGTDLALYLSVMLILYLLFRMYVRLEQMNREITQIVRAVALRETGLNRQEAGMTGGLESKSRNAGHGPNE